MLRLGNGAIHGTITHHSVKREEGGRGRRIAKGGRADEAGGGGMMGSSWSE